MTDNTWGGVREGAGAPIKHDEGPTERVFASVPSELVRRLEYVAKQHGVSRSEEVTAAIRQYLRKGKR